MARRGRCRCGSVLRFDKGPDGYKTRCPCCGSVVRLKAASVRAAAKKRKLACPCGARVRIRPGMTKATCPDCKRVLLTRKKPTARQAGNWPRSPAVASGSPRDAISAPQLEESRRTVTCEACQSIVSAEALSCPECGSSLVLTRAAPILDSQDPSTDTAVSALPYRLMLGWLAAAAALILVVAIVLIVSLRN